MTLISHIDETIKDVDKIQKQKKQKIHEELRMKVQLSLLNPEEKSTTEASSGNSKSSILS